MGGGFFGYPNLGRVVTEHARKDVAGYMVKLHVLALLKDVQKLFWYNYKDRRPGREKAENHFGLVDYWGYPKPVYAAYMNLIVLVSGKQFVKTWQLSSGLWIFEFKGSLETAWVTWCYPVCNQKISWSNLLKEIKAGQLVNIVNMMGTPLVIDKDIIFSSGEPIFITRRKSGTIFANSSGGK